MNKLNPTIKVGTILIVALIIAFQNNLTLNVLITIPFSVIGLYYQPKNRIIPIWGLVFLSSIGVFFTGSLFKQTVQCEQVNWWFLTMPEQIFYGVQLSSRVWCYAALGIFFSSTTTMQEMIASLQQQLKLPNKFAYGLMASFHMLPMIPMEYQKIKNSLYSRGINVRRYSVKLLLPLLVKSIRWSENLAFAMESKGFDDSIERTVITIMKISFWDRLFAIVTIGLAILLTILQIV